MKSYFPELIAAGLVMAPGAVSAVVPIDSGPIPGSVPVTIAALPGVREGAASVDGNLTVYNAAAITPEGVMQSLVVGTFDLSSGTTGAVPLSAGEWAASSGVSAGKILFGRSPSLAIDRGRLEVYDTVAGAFTTIDPDVEVLTASAIGGDTVVYLKRGANSTHELRAASISTGTQSVIRSGSNWQGLLIEISPSGDVVVWDECVGAQPLCGVYKAVRSASGWTVSVVSETAETEWAGDTDGTVVVYSCIRGGERDICWQPVGGAAEMRLELPGIQDFPTVSGGSIVFRNRPPDDGPADVSLYQIASNRLYRITETPYVEDWVPDITTLSNGTQHVVWDSVPAPNGDWSNDNLMDVFGLTFTLPPVQPPTFTFGGFLQPVDPLPALNSMRAGGAVPVKFSLGGYHGLGVFAAGYPKSQAIACNSTAPELGIEQTVSAGGSSLTYNASTDTYTYVWKTDNAWAGTCRQLVLGFSDGTFFRANFKFK